MDVEAALTGGDRRSLGRTEEVVGHVLLTPESMDELFSCLFHDDDVVRMRAGDALEKVCRQRPGLLAPYVDRILDDVAATEQPSVRWHVAQMLGEVALGPEQQRRALTVLDGYLRHSTDWIVLNCSLAAYAGLAEPEPSLRPRLRTHLERHAGSQHRSVAKRAQRLLAAL